MLYTLDTLWLELNLNPMDNINKHFFESPINFYSLFPFFFQNEGDFFLIGNVLYYLWTVMTKQGILSDWFSPSCFVNLVFFFGYKRESWGNGSASFTLKTLIRKLRTNMKVKLRINILISVPLKGFLVLNSGTFTFIDIADMFRPPSIPVGWRDPSHDLQHPSSTIGHIRIVLIDLTFQGRGKRSFKSGKTFFPHSQPTTDSSSPTNCCGHCRTTHCIWTTKHCPN